MDWVGIQLASSLPMGPAQWQLNWQKTDIQCNLQARPTTASEQLTVWRL